MENHIVAHKQEAVKNAYQILTVLVTITSATILIAYLKIKSRKSIQVNVSTQVIVAIIGFASMVNVMKAVLVLPFAVLKHQYVTRRQLKPSGEKVDGELHMGNVLNAQGLNTVPKAIYVTKAHAS
jgi:hypothetical protein